MVISSFLAFYCSPTLCSDLAAVPSSFQITSVGTCTGQQGLGVLLEKPQFSLQFLWFVLSPSYKHGGGGGGGGHGRLTLASGPGSRKCGCHDLQGRKPQ